MSLLTVFTAVLCNSHINKGTANVRRTDLNQETAFAYIRGRFQTWRSFIAEDTLCIGAMRRGHRETICHCEDVGEQRVIMERVSSGPKYLNLVNLQRLLGFITAGGYFYTIT